jgi:hypothetical protein
MKKPVTDSHMRFLLRVLLLELLSHRMLVFGGLLSNPRLPLFFALTIPFSICPEIAPSSSRSCRQEKNAKAKRAWLKFSQPRPKPRVLAENALTTEFPPCMFMRT